MDIIVTVFAALFVYRFIQYITTPLLRKTGFYRYFSPLFFIMPINKKTYDIHLGTSWDFFRLNKKKPKIFLILLLEGLLNLIDSIENNQIKTDVVFKGKIHFFKRGTLEKFGFTVKRLNPFEYLLFIFHYLELFFLKMLVLKNFNPPDIRKVTKVTFTAAQLVEKKELLLQTYRNLDPSPQRDIQPIILQYSTELTA